MTTVTLEVTRSDIEAAAERIEPHIRRTPVIALGDMFDKGFDLWLKLDHLQPTGSFKVRGAFSLLTDIQVPAVGIGAASGGNFGAAAAFACSQLGFRATIFVPETSPAEKIDRIKGHGPDVRVIPGYYHHALAECQEWVDKSGAVMAHAYDQAPVVAGQGTVAREIEEQVPAVDTILVAVGGGGLIGGIASWCRNSNSVVAVEPVLCNSLNAARKAGVPTPAGVGGVAASSLGTELIGEYAWYANQWIADSLLVEDEDIMAAQRWLWQNVRLVVEPAAATTVAALMTGAYTPAPGERVVAMISGGNVDPASII